MVLETGIESAEEQSSHPLTTPLVPIENTVQQPRKRRKTSNEVVSHLLGEESSSTNVVSAVLKASKFVSSYINVCSEDENDDVYFVSSPKELHKLNKYDNKDVKIKYGTSITDETPNEIASTRMLPDDYLHQFLYNSQPYSFLLKLDQYTELSKTERSLLNKDWLFGDEVRLACAQLLAGAILVDGEQILFLNTVEVYARSSSLDTHHERLDPVASFSSVPTPLNKYQNMAVLGYENDNSKKLIIGTYSFNALVTSSIRLDQTSELETGPSTKQFSPSRNTQIFIAQTSRIAANDIIETKKNTLYDFDILHQLRQLRSRLTSPSTYSISRACAMLTNQISCKPYTIFSILDAGSNTSDTDEKLASMVLRHIALKILNKQTTITKLEIDEILKLKEGDTVVLNAIKSISSLMAENESVPILHNQELETLLNTLASSITNKLPTYNEHVKTKFQQRIELLNKSSK